MTSKQYIEQQISAGYNIHLNDGVWWQKKAHFFFQPVNFLQKLPNNDIRPRLLKSILGYSYLVSDARYSNKTFPAMILSEEKLNQFSLDNLSKGRRRSVRKGLSLLEIKKIENINDVIVNMKDVCISMANRTRYGLPPQYYISNFNEWKTFMIREFNLPNREWWGAFHKNTLIAYTYNFLIDNTMYGSVQKSHSDYLHMYPNDALEFTFIEYCKGLEDCKELNYGPGDEHLQSINSFKESYGFERVNLPMYVKYNHLFLLAKKIYKFRQNIMAK